MAELEKQVTAKLCPAAKLQTPCTFQYESVVQNRDIWAVAFAVTPIGAKTQKETQALRSALEGIGVRPLDILREKTVAIAYYREKAGVFAPMTGEEFHKETLNPKSQIVVRYAPDFVKAGGAFAYKLPVVWETEGLAPSTTSAVSVSGRAPKEAYATFEILDLDDKPVPSVTFAACRSNGAACNAAAVPLKANVDFRLELDIKAERKIKTEQPAFKIVMKLTGETAPVVQLAIPFKPQPNYFLFGVTGFLFGGLIAVMMLFMRRKREKPAAA